MTRVRVRFQAYDFLGLPHAWQLFAQLRTTRFPRILSLRSQINEDITHKTH